MVFIAGQRRTLIAIEAKMYDTPTVTKMEEQLENQRKMLDYVRERLAVDDTNVFQLALLPQSLATKLSSLSAHVITWEELLEAYRPLAPDNYFTAMLGEALARYPMLVSQPSVGGKHNEVKRRGSEVYARHQAGDSTVRMVGRRGGLRGIKLREDIATGRWKTFKYETNSLETAPNHNWFPVEAFVALIDAVS